ncbi:glutamate dehydrogenase (NAD(P)+) [Rhizobium mesoamericanum]|nr:glutamate dehydrogenase (NAD(P)+) [Rhizobium mesoamericanum]
MTGKAFPEEMRDEFLEGGSEIDLVCSGLDDVMRGAYENMSRTLRDFPDIKDLRTAAYRIALNRIAEAYKAIGI